MTDSDAPTISSKPVEPGIGKKLYNGRPVPEGMARKAFKRLMKKERLENEKEEYLEKRRIKRRLNRAHQHRGKPLHPSEQTDSHVKVIIDCGFDDKMEEGERTSLAQQLTRCYSANRRARFPVELILSSFKDKLKQRFENELQNTHLLWQNIGFTDKEINEIEEGNENGIQKMGIFSETGVSTDQSTFALPSPATEPSPECIEPKESRMVYLTGDAKDVISELKEGYTYVVGGIVDKDRYKNLCLNKAKDLNVKTMRLPIDEYIRVSGRKILTTNQAFELLLRWLELRDWKLAFEAVIPSRKQIKTPAKNSTKTLDESSTHISAPSPSQSRDTSEPLSESA